MSVYTSITEALVACMHTSHIPFALHYPIANYPALKFEVTAF